MADFKVNVRVRRGQVRHNQCGRWNSFLHPIQDVPCEARLVRTLAQIPGETQRDPRPSADKPNEIAVCGDVLVGGEKYLALLLRLRDKHSIERIAMMPRQERHASGVCGGQL